MKKTATVFGLSILTLFLTGLILSVTGNPFLNFGSADEIIHIESATPVSDQDGGDLSIDICGQGLDGVIAASLARKIAHKDQKSFPVTGTFFSSLLVEDTLYLGQSGRKGLIAVNVKDAENPRLLGEYLVGRSVLDIQCFGSFLFVACGIDGIAVLGSRDDGTLEQINNIKTPVDALRLSFSGNRMVVASGRDGALFYQINADLTPILLQHMDVRSAVNHVECYNNIAYLTRFDGFIDIYSMAGGRLQHLDQRPIPTPVAMSRWQDNLYVAGRNSVTLFKLSDAKNLKRVKTLDHFGSIASLVPGSQYLYIIDGFSRLFVVSAADLTIDQEVALESDIRTLSGDGEHLFIAGQESGLIVVDPLTLMDQKTSQLLRAMGRCYDLQILDHWLFAATSSGLLVVDLSSKSGEFKQLTGRLYKSLELDLEGRRLLASSAQTGVAVFDIRIPEQPRETANWPNFKPLDLVAINQFLVMSRGAYGFDVVDISDPLEPEVCQSVFNVHVLDLFVDKEMLYVATKSHGLQIYQQGSRGLFSKLGEMQVPFPMSQFAHAVSVAVNDQIAYVANGRTGLMLVDVRRPEQPELLSLLPIDGFSNNVISSDKGVFVSSQRGGLSLVNVQQPERPYIESRIAFQGLSRDISIDGGFIYTSLNDAGVAVVPLPIRALKISKTRDRCVQIDFPMLGHQGIFDLFISNSVSSAVVDGMIDVGD